MSDLRKRVQEISAEYWVVREQGTTERVAVAQLVLALARAEHAFAEADALLSSGSNEASE